MTPVLLCWFANVGDIPAIRELIQLGVELNMKDQFNGNRTALHLAASTGNTHVIRLLIENKVELVQDDRRETAFQYAIRAENLEVIKLLRRKYGPSQIDSMDRRQVGTDMCIAASMDDTHKMQLYIEAGIPVTYGDYDGRTPLHVAASKRSEIMCLLLLAAGALKEAVDTFGNTPDLTWLATDSRRSNKASSLLLDLPLIERQFSQSLSRSSTFQRTASMPFSH
jgi:ankyrin repeat protein